MRIFNVSGDAFYPQVSGGVQVCLNELMLALQAMQHKPTLFAALWGGKLANRSRIAMRLTRRRWVRHRWESFEVYRAWKPWEHAKAVAELVQPDAILVHGTKYTYLIARAFSELGLPVSLYFHDVYFDKLGGDLRDLKNVKFISNSEYTRNVVRDKLGINSNVVPPVFFESRLYRVETSRKNITFINPVPVKGSELAFKIAELCPDIPFHFVQSWSLSPEEHSDIGRRLKLLPNVRFSRPVYDMRSIYKDAKLMLVPSQVDEAWGRVVSEAQCSGIPAIHARSGGLPEAAGKAGICLDRTAPASQWADAVRSLWHDEELYREKSDAAWSMAEQIVAGRAGRLQHLLDFSNGPAHPKMEETLVA